MSDNEGETKIVFKKRKQRANIRLKVEGEDSSSQKSDEASNHGKVDEESKRRREENEEGERNGEENSNKQTQQEGNKDKEDTEEEGLKRKKNERGREESQDSEDEESINRSVINEFREMKRLKLLSGKGINVMDLLSDPNHKRVTTNSANIGKGKLETELETELDLGQTFSAETNKRDEDGEMNKYIDKVMSERMGGPSTRDSSHKEPIEALPGASSSKDQTHDMFLKLIPEELLALARKNKKEEKEEMLSSQMLTSIPEVDLGVEERIKNIEKTEAARVKYFQKRAHERLEAERNKDLLAPQNLSACYKKEQNVRFDQRYIRHTDSNNGQRRDNRDNNRDNNGSGNNGNRNLTLRKPQEVEYDFEPVVQIGDAPATLAVPRMEGRKLPGKNTPSDDFVFERFKKNMHKR